MGWGCLASPVDETQADSGCLASLVGESHVDYTASRDGGSSWGCVTIPIGDTLLSPSYVAYIATDSDDTPLSPALPPVAMAVSPEKQTPTVISFETDPIP